jgi:ribosomal protein S18 acetylase RimI-like enzyme
MNSKITVVDYAPHFQQDFEKLNRAWIESNFRLEAIDKYVLTQPEEAIINRGGAILIALYGDLVAGVVALRRLEGGNFEFTKMAVDENFRRKGIGETLSLAAFKKARQSGAGKIILYSQSSMKPAISLYEKLGFKQVPLEPGTYERADVKMELDLDEA